jgi:signal transduction histidine kinase
MSEFLKENIVKLFMILIGGILFLFISLTSLKNINNYILESFEKELVTVATERTLYIQNAIHAKVEATAFISSRTKLRKKIKDYLYSYQVDDLNTVNKILNDALQSVDTIIAVTVFDTNKNILTYQNKFDHSEFIKYVDKFNIFIKGDTTFVCVNSILRKDNQRLGHLLACYDVSGLLKSRDDKVFHVSFLENGERLTEKNNSLDLISYKEKIGDYPYEVLVQGNLPSSYIKLKGILENYVYFFISLIGFFGIASFFTLYFKFKKDQKDSINRALNESNDHLVKFSHRIAHDLRAPIVNVSNLCQLIEDDLNEEDFDKNSLREDATQINTLMKELLTMINEALDFSKVMFEDVESSTFATQEILDEIKSEFLTSSQGVKLEFLSEGRSSIYHKKSLLKVILRNLITNSIKYLDSTKEEPRILVVLNTTDSSLRITVKDNGIGISNADQYNIYNLYSQVNKDSEGYGIGLNLVNRIVKSLGGEIELNSQKMIGTEFVITIPTIYS